MEEGEEEIKTDMTVDRKWQLHLLFFFYLELMFEFLFYPLSHMIKSHLPLPQFGADT